VEVQHVEVGGARDHLLDHREVRRDRVGAAAEAQRRRRARDQLGARRRVAAREQRHVVPEVDQRLGQKMDDALGAPVQLRGHALMQW
jgi:hypothetical protein